MVPEHVAIIMDGNGRWAAKRALPRSAGHAAGVKSVKKAVNFAIAKGIKVLTLFTLSVENFSLRPATEVKYLLSLLAKQLDAQTHDLRGNQVRISFIGDHSQFPPVLCKAMDESTAQTLQNTGLHLVIALNYSGQWDLVQAARCVATRVSEGVLLPGQVDAAELAQHLSLHDLPDPDLFIRTSGELRISNFLLWQLAYTELFFTDTLWPDFNEAVFEQACQSYTQRTRKFGKTSEQVECDNA